MSIKRYAQTEIFVIIFVNSTCFTISVLYCLTFTVVLIAFSFRNFKNL